MQMRKTFSNAMGVVPLFSGTLVTSIEVEFVSTEVLFLPWKCAYVRDCRDQSDGWPPGRPCRGLGVFPHRVGKKRVPNGKGPRRCQDTKGEQRSGKNRVVSHGRRLLSNVLHIHVFACIWKLMNASMELTGTSHGIKFLLP